MTDLDKMIYEVFNNRAALRYELGRSIAACGRDQLNSLLSEFSKVCRPFDTTTIALLSQRDPATTADQALNIFATGGGTGRQLIISLHNAGMTLLANNLGRELNPSFTPLAPVYTPPVNSTPMSFGGLIGSPASAMDDDAVIVDDEQEPFNPFHVASFNKGVMAIVPTFTKKGGMKVPKILETQKDGLKAIEALVAMPKNAGVKFGVYQLGTSAKEEGVNIDFEEHAEVVMNDSDEEEEAKEAPQINVKAPSAGGTPSKTITVKVGGKTRQIKTGGGLPQYLILCRDANGQYQIVDPPEDMPTAKDYDQACALAQALKGDSNDEDFIIYVLCKSNKTKESNVSLVSHAKIAVSKPAPKASPKPSPSRKDRETRMAALPSSSISKSPKKTAKPAAAPASDDVDSD
jgi:hypothetical protein